jgi:uncharacterized protein YggU (UPF0235/DUF167 family)
MSRKLLRGQSDVRPESNPAPQIREGEELMVNGRLKVKVRAALEGGKANDEVSRNRYVLANRRSSVVRGLAIISI